jgi:hypothetical protein
MPVNYIELKEKLKQTNTIVGILVFLAIVYHVNTVNELTEKRDYWMNQYNYEHAQKDKYKNAIQDAVSCFEDTDWRECKEGLEYYN